LQQYAPAARARHGRGSSVPSQAEGGRRKQDKNRHMAECLHRLVSSQAGGSVAGEAACAPPATYVACAAAARRKR